MHQKLLTKQQYKCLPMMYRHCLTISTKNIATDLAYSTLNIFDIFFLLFNLIIKLELGLVLLILDATKIFDNDALL